MKLNARTAGRCRRRLDHVSDRERATPVALAQGPPALHGCAVPVAGPRHPVFPFAKTFQLGRLPIRLNRSYFPSQPLQYLQYQRDFPRKPIMLDYVMLFFSRAVVNGNSVVSIEKIPPAFDAKAFLAKANRGTTISKYRKSKIIFEQGEPADSVFYIQKGKVKITVISGHGKEAVIAILGAADFCGEGCLAGQPRRMATAAAITECVITRLDKAAAIQLLHDEPMFSEMFMSYLLARTIRVEEDLVDQLFNSSEKRLARVLLLLANFGKEGKPEPLVAKISQETLAEMIGTTRSRVSFFMNKFRKLGFIDYNGGLKVHSSLLNVVLHETAQTKTPV